MYTITRFRIWLAQRAFGLRKSPVQPLEARPRFRPTLSAMEDRLPPGDVLWTALAGIRGMGVPPTAPAAVVRGLETPSVKAATNGKLQAALPETMASAAPRGGSRQLPPAQAASKPVELPGPDAGTTLSFGTTEGYQAPRPAGMTADAPAAPGDGVKPAVFTVTPPAAEKELLQIGGPRVDVGATAPVPTAKPEKITVISSETRVVPASEAGLPTRIQAPTNGVKDAGNAAKPDFTYQIPGATIGLSAKPDRIAVQLIDTTGAGLDGLTAKGGALDGATFVRWAHNKELAVVEGPGLGARAGKIDDPAVAFTTPVYVDSASGTELVILNEAIVKLTDWENAESFFKENGFTGYRNLAGTFDTFVATVGEGYGKPVLDAVARLQGAEGVAYAEPNSYQNIKLNYDPNDAEYVAGNMWHVKNTGQGGGLAGADVSLTKAWDVNPGGSTGMVFAAVDEGIDFAHEDLTPWVNPGETPLDGIDNDGNGWIDDINGWNFVNNNNAVAPLAATQNHGTAVAGLMAAKGDNGIGVVGGSYKGQVMSARIFQDSAATAANIASAILYAAGKKSDGSGTWKSAGVMNNSWGGGANTAAINDALTWATATAHTGNGVPTFFSSGNSNAPALGYPQSQALTTPGIITVGMMGNNGLPSYSAYGAGLDLITVSDGGTLNVNTTDRMGANGYNTDAFAGNYTGTGASGFGGTSAASPLAAGIGGLVLSQAASKSVTFSAAQMDAYLRNNTDIVGVADVGTYDPATGVNVRYGAGRLNAFDAVNNVGAAEADVISATGKLASGSSTDFGTIDIGGKATQTFRIRNGGTSQLNLSNLTIAGTNYSLVAGLDDTALTIGESATFTVAFSPTATAAAAGTATFTTNDANEGTYTLNFTGTGKYISIGGKAFEDWNGNGALDVNDPGIAGRTVFLDANNNGVVDTVPNNFTDAPGLFVPDGNTKVFATQTVSGLGGAKVADVNVTLNITHTWDSDLNVFLISPAGTRVELFTGVGGSGDNFTNTVLDDEGTTPITAGTAPFTGTFIPEGKLSTFDGEAAEGQWKLELADTVSGDTGTVQNWTLTIGTGEEARVTDANGEYRFYGLPAATYNVRQVVPAGWSSTTASPISVTVTGTSSNTTTNFGTGFNNSFYTNVYNDKNGSGTKNTGELPLAGEKVFLDENGNGTYDVGGNTTGSASPSLVIPDAVGTFVFSDITIAGAAPGGVADVDVTVNITHTWDSDIDVYLVAPSGSFTLLFSGVGGSGDNFTGTTLDDEAATSITAGTAPFTGSFQPQEPLSVFDGGLANGTWSLALADFAGGDVGTLNTWSLDIDLAEVAVLTDTLGNAFVDLPAGGPYTFKLVQPTGLVYTGPADGKYVVTASGTPLFNNYYGVAALPAVASYTINGGATQRSRVRSVEVTFSAPVTFSAGAFTFTRTGTYSGAAGDGKAITDGGASPQVSVATSVNGSGNTVATLTFTGAGGVVDGTSLADGVWRLAVDKTKVALGVLSPAANFLTPVDQGNYTTRIYRLFGDFNFDGAVDGLDKPAFDATLNLGLGDLGYLAAADRNNDDAVDGLDKPAFDFNLNVTIDP